MAPLEQLPPRVVRVRASRILSMWLGESEKNWQRVMDEVLRLADEEFVTPDGRTFRLPGLLVMEEADGLGRQRGHEGVHDRIMTTILQTLDPGRIELGDRLIIILATTNEPHLVDPALLRRLGGSIENFNRLRRRSFIAVLDKLTRDLPVPAAQGSSSRETWQHYIQRLAAWLYGRNTSDPGLVELTFMGATTPVIKYRRDFLTPALVDRAVQQAAAEACQAELDGGATSGITFEQLARALDAQLRGLLDHLTEANVGRYTGLPDGVRVAALRRLPQPTHLPWEFENG